jgi:hypothetical protein
MTYFVLDTDHLSILQRRSEPGYSILSAKLARYSPNADEPQPKRKISWYPDFPNYPDYS